MISQIVERFASGICQPLRASTGNLNQVEIISQLFTKSILDFIGLSTNRPVSRSDNLVRSRQTNETSVGHRIQRCSTQPNGNRGRNQSVRIGITVNCSYQILCGRQGCRIVVHDDSNQVTDNADLRSGTEPTKIEPVNLHCNVIAAETSRVCCEQDLQIGTGIKTRKSSRSPRTSQR